MDVTDYHPKSFTGMDQAVEKAVHDRYERFAMLMVVSTCNEAMELLLKWRRDNKRFYDIEERLVAGENLAPVLVDEDIDIKDYRSWKLDYEINFGPGCVLKWFGEGGKPFLDILNLTEEMCLNLITDIIDGERKLGIDEEDIKYLVNPEQIPEYQHGMSITSKLRRPLNPRKGPFRGHNGIEGPRVQCAASREAVRIIKRGKARNKVSVLRWRERWREKLREQSDNARDADAKPPSRWFVAAEEVRRTRRESHQATVDAVPGDERLVQQDGQGTKAA